MTTNHAIRVYEYGTPEVLRWEEADMPTPGEGEVLVRHTAVGLNYIDTYYRSGLYAAPHMPFVPGQEAAGVIVAVGPGVEPQITVGARVAYCRGPLGAYTEYRAVHQEHIILLPEDIADAYAAAALLKGETAHFLLRRTFNVGPQTTMLVRAAAGGVGMFLCQWGKALGARVIGSVSTEEKARFVAENGCDYPIIYTRENTRERVREITGGEGCNVVYDSVGAATFMESLDCLMPFGLMVSFGQASGPVPPFDVKLLAEKGSLFLTRPSLTHYKKRHDEYMLGAAELFELIRQGAIKVHVGQSYYLRDAARAHRELEAKETHGSTILLP